MNNQTTEQLKRINAKQTLGLPLTAHEKALQTLYGQPATSTGATRSDININKMVQEINASLLGVR